MNHGYPIGTWCTGAVTDFIKMLEEKQDFNEDINVSRIRGFPKYVV